MSAWVLPDHIADVLPSEARHIEELRRSLLDTARGYGYELVMPPLLEHLESLLTGTGEALDLQTFKLVDQLSGRTLGLRADTTPQVARIDAHLLNRQGVTRLCYAGSVLHTRPDRPQSTREPLQFGAEIYGHAGREADAEALLLALDCLKVAQVCDVTVDLSDARIVRHVLAQASQEKAIPTAQLSQILAALADKDASELAALSKNCPPSVQADLQALVQLYGDSNVLDEAKKTLSTASLLPEVLLNLQWLAAQVTLHHAAAQVRFDLADLGGYAYYSGARFAIYAKGAPDSLVRGGRYDEVGAVFGRNRPAAGFSLDIKELVSAVAPQALKAVIRAPWSEQASLQTAIKQLRQTGETVVCVLPGHESEVDEFTYDRELLEVAGQWVVKNI